jgi:glycosyltransferase involved in cell wall biosynthesis
MQPKDKATLLALPQITVATIAINREWIMPYIFKYLIMQDYPKDKIHFIYVDGGSVDKSVDIIRELLVKSPIKSYEIIILPGSNIPEARNAAAKKMKGEIIVFWDSDVIAPSRTTLADIVRPIIEEKVDIVGAKRGIVRITNPEEIDQLKVNPNYGYEKPRWIGMDFTAISKKLFDNIGYFDEDMTWAEDRELELRARFKGFKILTTKEVQVYDVKILEKHWSTPYLDMPLRRYLRGIGKKAKVYAITDHLTSLLRMLAVGQIHLTIMLSPLILGPYSYISLVQIPLYAVYSIVKQKKLKNGLKAFYRGLLYFTISFYLIIFYLIRFAGLRKNFRTRHC